MYAMGLDRRAVLPQRYRTSSVLLKNLELPDKSWLEVPSIKQPESARSRRMSRLPVGERHRNLLLGTKRTGDGLSRRGWRRRAICCRSSS
jgi:hypothetical protein